MKFGAHVSISGGIYNAPKNGLESGCDVIQIFTKNQMQWKVNPLTDEEIEKFRQEQASTGVNAVCVHASYLINLGGFDAYKLQRSRMNFLVEMQRAEVLGIPYLIVHPGSHMGKGEKAGLAKIASSLNYALDKCPDFKLQILLETTAGQGDNLGYQFEHLAEIIAMVELPGKVGVCVDTCHIFAAGYELQDKNNYENTMKRFDEVIGLDKLKIIHANDSKKEFGSRRDRHEHIGDGELGLAAFANLVNDERFADVPFIIETPDGAIKDKENLDKLRGLIIF